MDNEKQNILDYENEGAKCEYIEEHSGKCEFLCAPTGISASLVGENVELRWNGVPEASKYKVYRASSDNGSYSFVGESEDTIFADKSPLLSNYYKVSAVYRSGMEESDLSNSVFCAYSSNSVQGGVNHHGNGRGSGTGGNGKVGRKVWPWIVAGVIIVAMLWFVLGSEDSSQTGGKDGSSSEYIVSVDINGESAEIVICNGENYLRYTAPIRNGHIATDGLPISRELKQSLGRYNININNSNNININNSNNGTNSSNNINNGKTVTNQKTKKPTQNHRHKKPSTEPQETHVERESNNGGYEMDIDITWKTSRSK